MESIRSLLAAVAIEVAIGAAAAMAPAAPLGAAAAPAAQPSPEAVRGTYRLQGTARVAAGAVLDRDVDLHADALVEPGSRPGELRVRVVAEGYGCDLVARLGAGGALAFDAGQRCEVAITAPDARGHLEGQLRTGTGRIDGTHLTLDLAGSVDGTLSRRTGGVRVLGAEIPATWTPEVPVRGTVEASATGDVDRSRATLPSRQGPDLAAPGPPPR